MLSSDLADRVFSGEFHNESDCEKLHGLITEMASWISDAQTHMADIESAPHAIYLQVRGENVALLGVDGPVDWNDSEVTWCTVRVFDSDVQYVKASVLKEQAAEVARLNRALDICLKELLAISRLDNQSDTWDLYHAAKQGPIIARRAIAAQAEARTA
jgi:hypothetical protein